MSIAINWFAGVQFCPLWDSHKFLSHVSAAPILLAIHRDTFLLSPGDLAPSFRARDLSPIITVAIILVGATDS